MLVTDDTGEVAWSAEYTPFGKIARAEGLLEGAVKFTGKDLDQDTGLYYYNARWYDGKVGRFISADSYMGKIDNPQTLNLYIYTFNNPLVYVDPSGHNNNYYRKLASEYYYNTKNPSTEGLNSFIEANKGDDLSRYANNFLIGAGKGLLNTINPMTYYEIGKFGLMYFSADLYQRNNINTMTYINAFESYKAFQGMSPEDKSDVMMQYAGGVCADWLLGLGISKGISKLNDLAWLYDLNGFKFVDGSNYNKEAYDYLLEIVEDLDVATARNQAVFYSGKINGVPNRKLAEEFAKVNNKLTLEMTPGGKWLDDLTLFEPDSPITKQQAGDVWKKLSTRYAEEASGTVNAFVENSWKESIFNTVEYPILRYKNENIVNGLTGGH